MCPVRFQPANECGLPDLIAADISRHHWTWAVAYLERVRLELSSPSLCCCRLACGRGSGGYTLQVLDAEYCLRRSDWLMLRG